MMQWSFQFRITVQGKENEWRTSARPYEKAEEAAAGAAHVAAVCAMNGIIMETRLVPVTKPEPEPDKPDKPRNIVRGMSSPPSAA
jgi:hypothetical protein